ncbi:urease accessory protein UreF [Thiothrix lacustris]|uniref:Urease accessory protein UreF n=1 Tax=Thiothrix lacustris TaxID=525917 RepID=A0ABY9MLQ0_9GAMM|nr:urease accessory protein UreF [Thiothrix lacustris]WML89594.1 urease accessory protein UreF [Thiothrix lacustris]
MSTDLALLRLLHLVSPTLPIGSFTYSQGIEWAVECGWVTCPADLRGWLESQLHGSITQLDIPVLQRLYQAVEQRDTARLAHWIDILNASRETSELLLEEKNRGRALTDLLIALEIPHAAAWKPLLAQSQSAAFALAAVHWHIPLQDAAGGYVWSWLENLVLSAVKIIPLGQTQGQKILHQMTPLIPAAVVQGLQVADDDIGAASPALAIASSRHETQYTRLFRS